MSRKLFTYSADQLYFGAYFSADINTSLKSLNQEVGSYKNPVWLYKKDIIEERIKWIQNWPALGRLHYAMKANFHPEILKLIKNKNCGIDAVSLGEMKHAVANGFLPQDIILSGVAKSQAELTWAIENEIYQINIESTSELQKIIHLSKTFEKKISLAIRVNPDIETGTHPGIATALKDSKFGVDFKTAKEMILQIATEPQLKLKAISFHLGSQITNVEVYQKALQLVKPFYLESRKICPTLERLDLGGGLGIDYHNADSSVDHDRWLRLQNIYDLELKDFKAFFILEMGRFLVARSAVLIAKIEVIKQAAACRYMILDAGMSLLLRPALYQAYHQILPLTFKPGADCKYTVVGPICESTDILVRDKNFSNVTEGDLVAICDAGAYGSSMSSRYNLREPAEELFI